MTQPFRGLDAFHSAAPYRLLPFRFDRLNDSRYVATNDVGELVVLTSEELTALVERRLPREAAVYANLKSRHFIADESARAPIDLLALKYRTRLDSLAELTGLHIFVVTLRCDHSCHYCQVSRQTADRANFDLTKSNADLAVDLVFKSPSKRLKIEFQGGEPLLAFEMIEYVVARIESLNETYARDIQYVITTNMSHLTEEVVAFCKRHRITLSTSLDGPRDLHDRQRPLKGASSHDKLTASLRMAREALGHDSVSALMTTTPASLERVEEIVEEYVRLDFHEIFLRNLSPYGFAVRTSLVRKYDIDDWIAFFKRGLRRVLDANHGGYPLREVQTAILLQKMVSPRGANYVDLQSPAGIGISAIVYNYDGSVFASDEGRMLAEMGDDTFRLGHVTTDSWEEMLGGDKLIGLLQDTMLESAPRCTECAFMPYCGAEPVFHAATQGDVVGHKAFSAFCKKQMAMCRHLIELLDSAGRDRDVLLSWV